MEKTILIYNPTAGRETIKSYLEHILDQLTAAGFDISTYETKCPGDATRTASELSEDYDVLIAAGGDGTLHEIINGIGSRADTAKLGIIPTGTSNDFARALGIPIDIRKACEIIAENRTEHIDVGSINNKLFINIAGGGVLTHISYAVPSKLKTYLGQLAYYAKSLEELPKLRPVLVRIETPEFTMEDEIMVFLTANSRSFGGFDSLAPNARINDGLIDLIIVKKLGLGDFINLAAKFYSGEHINHPKIIYQQISEINVTSSEKVSLNADGEYAGKLPCTVKVRPQHIKIITPEQV